MPRTFKFKIQLLRNAQVQTTGGEGRGEVVGGEGQGEVIGGEGQGEVIGGEGAINDRFALILTWLSALIILTAVVVGVTGWSPIGMHASALLQLAMATLLFVLVARNH